MLTLEIKPKLGIFKLYNRDKMISGRSEPLMNLEKFLKLYAFDVIIQNYEPIKIPETAKA